MAIPGALAGVLWMLVLTGTTINVESLMGTIMAVGVGVANGNLLITFANEMREEGRDSVAAAIEAGRIRLRPIIMTALAMILGMLPMALGLGAGSVAERAAWPRSDRRSAGRDADDAVRGAGDLLDLRPHAHHQAAARRQDRRNHGARCVVEEYPMESGEARGYERSKRGRHRFVIASAIAVILVSGASAGIVLAYQMRLRSQTEQLDTQIDRGPHVLVEPIHPSESAREYEIPITMRGYVETPVYAKIPGYLKDHLCRQR